MPESANFHIYENVLVSGVEYDFSRRPHEQIPVRLYADWAALLVKLARALDPSFDPPPFPGTLVFHTESIHSDGPYSANADYYFLDLVSGEFKGENGCGIKIHFENGRIGGENPVNMETSGLRDDVSSYIYKSATSPLARILIRHAEAKASEIAAIIARHRKSCESKFSKWKTTRGTYLIENELKKIPSINVGIGLEGGVRFEYAAAYVETTPSGEIVKKYGEPYPYSIEDEMTVSDIHRVIGDRFYRFYYSHRFWSDPEVTAELLLSGLEPCEGVLPFEEKNLFD